MFVGIGAGLLMLVVTGVVAVNTLGGDPGGDPRQASRWVATAASGSGAASASSTPAQASPQRSQTATSPAGSQKTAEPTSAQAAEGSPESAVQGYMTASQRKDLAALRKRSCRADLDYMEDASSVFGNEKLVTWKIGKISVRGVTGSAVVTVTLVKSGAQSSETVNMPIRQENGAWTVCLSDAAG